MYDLSLYLEIKNLHLLMLKKQAFVNVLENKNFFQKKIAPLQRHIANLTFFSFYHATRHSKVL